MKKTHQSTILVLDKHQQKTSSYHINSWLLHNLKPTLIGLSAASAVLFVGVIGVGIKYYQTASENQELRAQVKYLDGYTSTEAANKISELKKTEKSINQLEDYLQKRGQGYAVPDSFTHGSSEQRMQWFQRGFNSGDINQCNTFASS